MLIISFHAKTHPLSIFLSQFDKIVAVVLQTFLLG